MCLSRKDRKVIDHALNMKLYPTIDEPPRFYGLPKAQTISLTNFQYLATVLSPLVGKTEHYVRNSKDLRMYDVSALPIHQRHGGQSAGDYKKDLQMMSPL